MEESFRREQSSYPNPNPNPLLIHTSNSLLRTSIWERRIANTQCSGGHSFNNHTCHNTESTKAGHTRTSKEKECCPRDLQSQQTTHSLAVHTRGRRTDFTHTQCCPFQYLDA
ncbi:hypothetical protein DQ04_14881030 [Trypanosoma grayi]|uniref:hypothetical protein n=1 Tax=Trypanosoma grayi TaxID=71804 RepID=UPI0004F47A28|nr:hypothetical protein DQ04_14881030 [Trypanosoma grayi]KEG06275.1 hypothetical protein DQ04_14881030 [Trypanosoma grayi]